jgi:hypothetical protein
MSKYEPLPQFLSFEAASTQRMNFDQIERILGFKLPRSAYEHEAWWSNNATGHSHARAWLDAGWRTKAVDLKAHRVTFQRVSAPKAVLAHNKPLSHAKHDPWGCMGGTVTILPGVDLAETSGERWNAEEGRLLNE